MKLKDYERNLLSVVQAEIGDIALGNVKHTKDIYIMLNGKYNAEILAIATESLLSINYIDARRLSRDGEQAYYEYYGTTKEGKEYLRLASTP